MYIVQIEQGLNIIQLPDIILVSKWVQRAEEKVFLSSFIKGILFVLKKKCDIQHNNEIKLLKVANPVKADIIFRIQSKNIQSNVRPVLQVLRHPTASVSWVIMRSLEYVSLYFPFHAHPHNIVLCSPLTICSHSSTSCIFLTPLPHFSTSGSSNNFLGPKKRVYTP